MYSSLLNSSLFDIEMKKGQNRHSLFLEVVLPRHHILLRVVLS